MDNRVKVEAFNLLAAELGRLLANHRKCDSAGSAHRLVSYLEQYGDEILSALRASDTGRSEAEAKAAAAKVCHDEQMTVWSDEMSDALSLGGYLRSDLDYEDVLAAHRVISREIRSLVESAFCHPELAAGRTALSQPAKGEDDA